MADTSTVQINLRLPSALYEQLSVASEKAGVPKNKIFNEAVTAAVKDFDGHHEGKPKYVHTCVRLPSGAHDAVRNMANCEYGTINTQLVQMLASHLGVGPCVAEEEK
jgi:hypothetical protein